MGKVKAHLHSLLCVNAGMGGGLKKKSLNSELRVKSAILGQIDKGIDHFVKLPSPKRNHAEKRR